MFFILSTFVRDHRTSSDVLLFFKKKAGIFSLFARTDLFLIIVIYSDRVKRRIMDKKVVPKLRSKDYTMSMKLRITKMPKPVGIVLLLIPVISFAAGRFILVRNVIAGSVTALGLAADIFFALGIIALAYAAGAVHISISAVITLFFFLYHIVAMEMIVAKDTVPVLSDLQFADKEFFKGSALHIEFAGYLIILIISIIPLLFGIQRFKVKGRGRLTALFAGMACFLMVAAVTSTEPDWHRTNPVYLSIRDSAVGMLISGTDESTDGRAAERPNDSAAVRAVENELYGEPFVRNTHQGSANILIAVLEGIPAVYLRQVQEETGIDYPIVMKELSGIAEDSLVIPNFLTHSRQTIRGLYAMQTGDYSKLSITTPKIYEYLSLPEDNRPASLARILKDRGYRNYYLQAADLSYMSKDRFMSAAGFDEVYGKQFFKDQYVPFAWGPDDKTFFEQSADFIKTKNENNSAPWLIELLTVGTHHPYAVPDEFRKDYQVDKEAAVAYLDQAVGNFYRELEEAGILENTILIFTSDESHGVTGQPFGRYWGLMIVCAPGITGTMNKGIFGLIDVPASLLDFLRFQPVPPDYPRYSFFRRGGPDRNLLFGPYITHEDGSIYETLNQISVKQYIPKTGILFSPAYEERLIEGEEGVKLASEIISLRRQANQSLASHIGAAAHYTFLGGERFELGQETRILTTGQYLDLPGGSTISVELEATVLSGHALIRPQMIQYVYDLGVPEIETPPVAAGKSLHVSFRFPVKEDVSRVWAALYAKASAGSPEALIKIDGYTLKISESEQIDTFELTRMEVREKSDATVLGPLRAPQAVPVP
jgi:phosphoglycerol transferase MdoB-like AlkP superfamily enzyme